MGLSDGERLTGIMYSIKRIRKHVNDIKECRDYTYHKSDLKDIFALSDKLWHSFLGKDSNSLHWLFGSPGSNSLQADNHSLWANIVRSHLPKLEYDENKFRDEEPEIKYFNPFDGFLNISGLIKDTYISKVYEIYLELETLSYYVRRYKDSLLEELDNLNILISDLYGACFEFMENKEEYAKAYVLNQILKIVYNRTLFFDNNDEKGLDSVDIILNRLNFQHDLPRAMNKDVKYLAEIHIKLDKLKREKSKDLLLQRLLCAVELCGGIEYDHINKQIIDICKKDPILKSKSTFINKFLNEWSDKRKESKKSDSEDSSKQYEDINQLRYSTY